MCKQTNEKSSNWSVTGDVCDRGSETDGGSVSVAVVTETCASCGAACVSTWAVGEGDAEEEGTVCEVGLGRWGSVQPSL